MDNFKAVYRILSALEKAMDYPAFDIEQIGAHALGVSDERWCRYIERWPTSDTLRAFPCRGVFPAI